MLQPTNRVRHGHFLAAWMRSPLKMGAFIPSSKGLARAMAAQLDIGQPGVVVELGAGTGAVTHALLETGLPPERLMIVERDLKLCGILSSQFHGMNIVCADAAELVATLERQGIKQINAIISSLPLLSMNKSVRRAVVEQMAIAVEQDGGSIIQFTYGPGSAIGRDTLRRHHLTGKRVKTIIANMPPAHVWVYRQSPPNGGVRL